MTHRMTLIALALMFALAPAVATFAEDGDQQRRKKRGGGEGPFAQLNLTEEQKAQVKEVMQSHREGFKQWKSENKEKAKAIREKMQAARKAGDKEAMEAAKAEMKALGEGRPKFDEVISDLEGILDADQIAKLRQMHEERKAKRGKGGKGKIGEKLGLTPEQIEQAKPIFQAHREAVKQYREQNKDAFKAAKEKMKEAKKSGDQEAAQAAKDEMKQLKEGGPSFDDLVSKLDGILTDDQIAKMKQMHEERRNKAREKMKNRRGGDENGQRRGRRGGQSS